MVIKTLRWKVAGFTRLVDYVGKELIDYVGKEGDERLEILHNLQHTNDLSDVARQFAENDAYRKQRKNGVTMYHEILSFHARDREAITPSMLEDITREYLRLRAPHALAYAAPHFDRDHVHIHIAISGVEFRSSKTLRMDNRTFIRVRRQIERYQLEKYPELEHSIVHLPKPVRNKELLKEMEEERLLTEKHDGDRERLDESTPLLPLTTRRFFSNLDLSRMTDDERLRKLKTLQKLRDSRRAVGRRPHQGLDDLIEDIEHLGPVVGHDAYQRRLEELEVIQEARALRDKAHEEPAFHLEHPMPTPQAEVLPESLPEPEPPGIEQRQETPRLQELEQIQEERYRHEPERDMAMS